LATRIPFSGTQPDQVGFELGDHGQHVEQQPAHGISRVVDGAAEVETDLPGSQLVRNRPGIGQRSGEPVQFGHDQGVPGPAGRQRLPQPGTFPVGARQAVIDVDPLGLHAQLGQAVALGGQVLLLGGRSGVSDQ
jgi:hypothetical protein